MKKDGKRRVRTTVEDHGTGISKEVREHLFDPFHTGKRPDKGTGLGLSISYSIMKEHDGELSVESEVGKWTRFHMDLPISDHAEGVASPVLVPPTAASRTPDLVSPCVHIDLLRTRTLRSDP